MIPADIDAELQFHIESRARELMEAGLPRDRALAQAEREFGNRAAIRAGCEDAHRHASRAWERRHYWTGVQHDLRHALRAVVRAPVFSLAAITILTLGIGLTTAVFAVLHGTVLNPLPYPESRALHQLFAVNPSRTAAPSAMSAGDFFALRDALSPGAAVGGYMSWPVSLTGVPEPERLDGALVSAGLFETLGVRPIEGRTFLFDEEQPGCEVAIISSRLAARLGLAGRAAGAAIRLGQTSTTVVGVMPPGFAFPQRTTDVWIPLALAPADRANHESRWLHTIARLDPATQAQALDRAGTVMARLAAEFPESNEGWTVRAEPLKDVVVGRSRPTLVVLSIAIASVLLVMLVNLVTLVTSRVQRRRGELAVQQALGAGHWRILRQLGAECLILTLAGGTLGLMMATGLVGAFQLLAVDSVPRANEVVVAPWIAGFAVVVAALGLVAMTVLPVWSLRAAGRPTLAASSRGVSARHRPSRVLVVAQTAVAALLLVAAGLLGETFLRLSAVDLGFTPAGILTLRVSLPRSATPERQAAYFDAAVRAVAAVPGVTGAGATSDLPLSGNSLNVPIATSEQEHQAADDSLRAALRVITPGYLDTIGVSVRGRTFTTHDLATGPGVALVNASFAERHWPGAEAIGRRVRTSEDRDWRTIVGVVADVHHAGLTEGEGPAVYVPHAQKAERWMTWMSLAVRTDGDPLRVASPVRAALAALDRQQPVSEVRTLDDLVARALALPRLAATIASLAALASVVLALLGIAALLWLVVSSRTPEYAVRLALGAEPARLAWVPVRESAALVAAGGTIGLAVAAAGAQVMASLLHGVSPTDWRAFAVGVVALAVIAGAAAIGPARAIARIDPARTLRG